jgi:hypothetical protein
LQFDLALDATTKVRMRGIIDRVDWKNGVFRVLDYKTGLDNKKFKSVEELFDRSAMQRNKAAFQALFYSWLFQQQGGITNIACQEGASGGRGTVIPGLLNTRQIFEGNFDARFFLQEPGNRSHIPLENMTSYQKVWEEGLREILTALLDPALPFSQTINEASCLACNYNGICQRH